MIRRFIILMTISAVLWPLSLQAAEKRGAQLVVFDKAGGSMEGELIAVKDEALLLKSREGRDVTLDINEVKAVRLEKKSKLLWGAGLGSALGGMTGAILFNDIWYEEHGDLSQGQATLRSGLLFGSVGLFLGGMYGMYAGQDKYYPVAQYQPPELKVFLTKLRKQARVRDFQ